MNFPTWTKPGLYGAVAGAALAALVGFTAGGWVTGGAAEKMAQVRAQEQVTQALVPICVDNASMDPDRDVKFQAIQKAASYNRFTEVMEAGWATMPGESSADQRLARACLDELKLDGS